MTLWLLGYPDQALKRSREAIALAQELAHPFSLAVAQFAASFFYAFRRDVPATQEMAEACINLSVEKGFTHWEASARMFHGWALVEQGRAETGIAQMRQGKADFHAIGSEVGHSHQLAMLASAYGKMGQAQEGLILLAEALETVARTGERYYEAEIQRLKGELLQGAEAGGPNASCEAPEACYLKAIEVARAQQAKSWELRATVSLCRLWQEQGRHEEARHMLAEIYGWFSEGFDTPDLKEAKALLEALA